MINSPRILIVEDQSIVALDIQNRLKSLKYNVAGIASSGAGAIKKAEELKPDLILMDIMLKGDMDGINAANEIRKRIDIPIIYLTAYADNDTLQRAKITRPFGYLLKPFEEKELYTTIEMSLYRHKMEREIKENELWFESILSDLNLPILLTDINGKISFANNEIQNLIGLKNFEIINNSLDEALSNFKKYNKRISFDFDDISSRGSKFFDNIIFTDKNKNEKVLSLLVSEFKKDNSDKKSYLIVIEDITKEYFERFKNIRDFIVDSSSYVIKNISKDMSNVFTSIISKSSVLRSKSDQVFFKDLLTDIENTSFYAIDKINSFLNTLKESNDINTFDINEVIDNLRNKFNSIFSNVQISIQTNDEPLLIKANKFHIEKALKNTVLNACESIISGGKILISTDKIKINDDNSDFYVKISILDNGKGISKENNFKIFYPYYTDKSNKDGLGLTFILAIIKENNGMVSFESKENEGTIFNLYFPLIN